METNNKPPDDLIRIFRLFEKKETLEELLGSLNGHPHKSEKFLLSRNNGEESLPAVGISIPYPTPENQTEPEHPGLLLLSNHEGIRRLIYYPADKYYAKGHPRGKKIRELREAGLVVIKDKDLMPVMPIPLKLSPGTSLRDKVTNFLIEQVNKIL